MVYDVVMGVVKPCQNGVGCCPGGCETMSEQNQTQTLRLRAILIEILMV